MSKEGYSGRFGSLLGLLTALGLGQPDFEKNNRANRYIGQPCYQKKNRTIGIGRPIFYKKNWSIGQ